MSSAENQADQLEAIVGHPGDLWDSLKERVQAEAIRSFGEVTTDWLAVMWCLDAYRRAGVVPRDMGDPTKSDSTRLGGVYRLKGGWFSELMSLLLQNRTHQVIKPRTKVRGFSQFHQIDLAWPSRKEDVLVCCETKVTGGPPYGTTGARGATSDWTNRRKELKFAATDLKLWRRQRDTAINHWGHWTETATPKVYFLWAARLRTESKKPDQIGKLAEEAQALINTYLQGAGVVAWKEAGDHYEIVPLAAEMQVTDLDDVLYRIESEIKVRATDDGSPPAPVKPEGVAVDVERLRSDPQRKD